ncbi:hypothetical protein H4217_006212 [Coemansia sp. RSA 1939]|nr:hypothetical protein H4217_006212 [Coemansia sp. RSA 1939]KAJ2606033.1 hypothetical protein EV177_006022 [Coemansia sp. RSA 1804]
MNKLPIKKVAVKFKILGVAGFKDSMKLVWHMKKFGTLTSFKIHRDPLTREMTGIAHATYLHYDEAAKALKSPVQTVDGLPEPFHTINIEPYVRGLSRNK